ncbi:MAG: DUF488 family protein [Nitrospirae bacterium]|nr:DUF488 family protein [Nitrospirota bacterium]
MCDLNVVINKETPNSCLAQEPKFYQGINRLVEGLKNYLVAMMCAEKDPIVCHRTIIICRNLRSKDIEIKYILGDGKIENNVDFEHRLLEMSKLPQHDLFRSDKDLIEQAYDFQGEKIVYMRSSYEKDNKNTGDIGHKAGAGRG